MIKFCLFNWFIKDPIRCDDAHASFEEVLRTAKKQNADFVLLAGDTFHENKPSRLTTHSTLVRHYVILLVSLHRT